MRALNGRRATIEVAVTIPHTISGTLHFRAFFLFPKNKSQEIPEFDFGTPNYVVHYFRRRVHHFRPPRTPSSLAQCKDQEKALVTYLMKQKCQIALVKLWEYYFVFFSDVFLLLDSAILEAS
ncbi:hypothetical protein VNO80_22460 [Phaseolus coccineus]|uniref:Uncharacterized protein n=1 Tax=Phaseolus coccineus TaxID=3886 RepID=A0AAN9M9S5_PHACN